jgi:hypothetical protein
MIDRTTKIILALIALGLIANAVTPLVHPTPARAAGSYACEGKMDASPFGIEYPGGYDIKFKCE